jgi:hypothetical protein
MLARRAGLSASQFSRGGLAVHADAFGVDTGDPGFTEGFDETIRRNNVIPTRREKVMADEFVFLQDPPHRNAIVTPRRQFHIQNVRSMREMQNPQSFVPIITVPQRRR